MCRAKKSTFLSSKRGRENSGSRKEPFRSRVRLEAAGLLERTGWRDTVWARTGLTTGKLNSRQGREPRMNRPEYPALFDVGIGRRQSEQNMQMTILTIYTREVKKRPLTIS